MLRNEKIIFESDDTCCKLYLSKIMCRMKKILKTGWVGLVLVLLSCKSVNNNKMFYDGVKPKKFLISSALRKVRLRIKKEMYISPISQMIKFIFGIGKRIK